MEVTLDSEPPTWSPDGRRVAFKARRAGVEGIWVVRADGRGLRLLAEDGNDPVWAPRGSRVAYVKDGIEVVDADGGGRRRLTGGGVIYSPTWSPDARALAFVHWDPEGERSTLYRVSAQGGSPRPLASTDDRFKPIADPGWSPRGRTIVFTEGQGGPGSAGVIKTVDANGGVAREVGFGARPVWSPSGRRIAAATHSEIQVVNADGSGDRIVRDVGPARLKAGPVWSQDGQTLLYASVRDRADNDLFVVNADGSQRRRLTSNNLEDVLPAWSPAHTRIAFARGTGRDDTSIWIMNASGTKQHRLGLGTHPSWSPSGSRLAFERQGAVFTMTDRGQSIRRIVEGERPVWAPGGTRIAFLRDTTLLEANAETGAVRPLADLGCENVGEGGYTGLSSPEWSRDARRLVVAKVCDYGRRYALSAVLVDAAGGGTRQVPIAPAPHSRIAWSPDGARIAYSRGVVGDAPQIITTRLDGTSRRTVTLGAGYDHDPDW
jgi:TolB protein